MRWYINPGTSVARCLVIAAATVIAVCNSADPVQPGSSDATPSNTISVDLYYESLCYDSIQFVKRQLLPTFQQLGSNLHVTYIPYGKATHNKVQDDNGNERWDFNCQHGAPECYGNKAQACGIKEILTNAEFSDKQRTLVNFVGCVMGANDPSEATPECLSQIGLNENRKSLVQTCASTAEGDELLAKYGDKTYSLRPNLSFVPTIVINGVFSHDNQRKALRDFKGLICDNMPAEQKPAVCLRSN